MATLDTAKTRIGLGGPSINYTRPFTAKGAGIAIEGNIIFGQGYNMIHPIHESPLRPTDLTEIIVRKRDKKPIISGGDH